MRPLPLLVGELNPHHRWKRFALYPRPKGASGARLARILDMLEAEYLRSFERANLCTGAWSLRAARRSARQILDGPNRRLVLLGRRVCQAFGLEFQPFATLTLAEVGGGMRHDVVILPHPSGRCRIWNDPRSARKARRLVLD